MELVVGKQGKKGYPHLHRETTREQRGDSWNENE